MTAGDTSEHLPEGRGRVRILLVDDHTFLRAGTRRILEDESDFEVVGEAGDGEEALDLAQATNPDVVVLDIGLPGMDGIRVCSALRARRPEQRVVVLTGHTADVLVQTLHRLGVEGYYLKSAAPQDLVAGIRIVGNGGRAYCAEARRVIEGEEEEGRSRLTHKEAEVLRALERGLKNREIADELQMSVNTVEFHVRNLFLKLGASSRTEVIARGRQLRWLDTHEAPC
jgi:DNA-binding NarL/FixJ family response regulator